MDKRKAENRIADLVQDVKEANGNTDQMERLYMAVAFPDEPESDQDETTGQDNGGMSTERPSMPAMLAEVIAFDKAQRSELAAPGGRGSEGGDLSSMTLESRKVFN